MEIHAPEGPITSLKDVLIHLGIVTVGILIALSFDGLVEWRHHQELAAEARENIANEIRDNKAELDGFLKTAPELRKQHLAAVKFFKDRLANQKITENQLSLGWSVITLNDSSWTTAQAVGALSYMGYAEVKRYAPIYRTQEEFLRLQERTLDAVTSSVAVFSAGEDPNKFSEPEIRSEMARVEASLAAMQAETQIGEGLQKQYSDFLAKNK
jgi:hypothetical protein